MVLNTHLFPVSFSGDSRSLIGHLPVTFGGDPNSDVADSVDGAYFGPFIFLFSGITFSRIRKKWKWRNDHLAGYTQTQTQTQTELVEYHD